MRGYHAFLKQVPTSPPPATTEDEANATADSRDVVVGSGPAEPSDWSGQAHFVGGLTPPTNAVGESDA